MPGTSYVASVDFSVAANKVLTLDVTGQFLAFEDASQSNFEIRIGDDSSFVQFAPGIIWEPPVGDYFDKVQIRDTSGSGVTGTLRYGLGSYRDTRVTLSGGIQSEVPSEFEDVADVSLAATSTTAILAANSQRREAIITNLSSTITLRIGSSSAGATRGTPLLPNGTVVLETAGAIYGYNPDGSAVDVAVTWTEFA